MLRMGSDEGILFVDRQRAGRGGNTQIAFQVAEFEPIVSAAGILSGHFHAFDRHEHGLLFDQCRIGQFAGRRIDISVIRRNDFRQFGIQDIHRSIGDLIGSVVGRTGTADFYGHAAFQAQILHRIGGQVVNVVAAVFALNIQAVAGIAFGLRNNAGHYAGYRYRISVLGFRILLETQDLIGRDFPVKGKVHCLSCLRIFDGRRQGILDRFRICPVNTDGILRIPFLNFNVSFRTFFNFDSPFDFKGLLEDLYRIYHFVAGGRCLRLLCIHCLQIVSRCLQIVGFGDIRLTFRGGCRLLFNRRRRFDRRFRILVPCG